MSGAPFHLLPLHQSSVCLLSAPLSPLLYTAAWRLKLHKLQFPNLPAWFWVKFCQWKKLETERWEEENISLSFWWYSGRWIWAPVFLFRQHSSMVAAAAVSAPRASAMYSSYACTAYFGCPTSTANKTLEQKSYQSSWMNAGGRLIS